MEYMNFKTLRKYLAHSDRFSICMLETTEYSNYMCLKDIPNSYDELYVYGIGMIESEFYQVQEYVYSASGDRGTLVFLPCNRPRNFSE